MKTLRNQKKKIMNSLVLVLNISMKWKLTWGLLPKLTHQRTFEAIGSLTI